MLEFIFCLFAGGIIWAALLGIADCVVECLGGEENGN